MFTQKSCMMDSSLSRKYACIKRLCAFSATWGRLSAIVAFLRENKPVYEQKKQAERENKEL